MKEKKYHIAFDRCEQGILINALNEMRNRRIFLFGVKNVIVCLKFVVIFVIMRYNIFVL